MGEKNKLLKNKARQEKSRAWQKAHREKLREQGIRLIQVQVPAGNVEMVRAMCKRLTAGHLEMIDRDLS